MKKKGFYFITPHHQPIQARVLDEHNGQYKIGYERSFDLQSRRSYPVCYHEEWVGMDKVVIGITDPEVAIRIVLLEERVKKLEKIEGGHDDVGKDKANS